MIEKHPDEVEQSIIQWAESRDVIRAVLLTSTRAVPGARVDLLSDYDVILIVQSLEPFTEDRSWIDDFGDVLVVYWDPVYPDPVFGIDMTANVTQYVDGLKIDFTVQPVSLFQKMVGAPALPEELDAGYRILLDKDGLTESMSQPTFKAYIPKRPTRETYLTLINDFFSEAPYVAKCLWRDELLPAKWCLDFDMKHTYIRQLLEWRVEVNHGWSRSIGSLGKGLEKYLPADLWAEFEETFAGARLDENWQALEKIMIFFRRVAVEVGESLGFEYPQHVHERVSDYVEQIRKMKSTGY